jgi:hypothetical protein
MQGHSQRAVGKGESGRVEKHVRELVNAFEGWYACQTVR